MGSGGSIWLRLSWLIGGGAGRLWYLSVPLAPCVSLAARASSTLIEQRMEFSMMILINPVDALKLVALPVRDAIVVCDDDGVPLIALPLCSKAAQLR